jgi:predicted transcriptional regulator
MTSDSPTKGKTNESEKEIEKNTDFETFKMQELKNNVIDYYKQRPHGITNTNILASKFRISTSTIQRILFKLMKENIVRRDTYPGSGKAIFSYSASIENRAIDHFAKNLNTEILSDNSFVRVSQRYEIDAIIQTSLMNYVIEVKSLDNFLIKRVDDAVNQLMKIEEHIKLSPIKLVLIIATKKKFEIQLIEEYMNIENLSISFFEYAD